VALGDRDCEYFCVILLDLCAASGYVLHSYRDAMFTRRRRVSVPHNSCQGGTGADRKNEQPRDTHLMRHTKSTLLSLTITERASVYRCGSFPKGCTFVEK
jgi:hypothetical protein